MEALSYLIRYVPPVLLSFVTVVLVAIANHFAGPLIWPGRTAEPIDILAYSVRTSGPTVFGLAFMVFFYGIEAAKDGYQFSKYACVIAFVCLSVSFIVNVACIPKVNPGQ